ncbi:MAG TPA: cysteine desulfurase-like protein [Acidimicrobiales bacterium]|nr:cysteine desulfurase-like protein [Acidimicrobiales bacterium]
MQVAGERPAALDTERIRAQFPALDAAAPPARRPLFLDAPGGTQVPERVVSAMCRYLVEDNSNTGGAYPLSVRTDELIARARVVGAAFVGGDPDGIAFGQNMTTLNFNLVRAVGRTLRPGDEILTTALDHDANISPWLLMAEDRGLVVREVGLTDRLDVDLDDLRTKLGDRTRVVAFCLASNAVGTVTPARKIAELAHEAGALAWGDAVAYAPHRRIDVAALGVDVVLCSPYKFFGPHLGMAWLRPDLARELPAERVRPAAQVPAGHRFETGTLSHEALAGFVAAVDYLASLGAGDDLGSRLTIAYDLIRRHESDLARALGAGLGRLPAVRTAGLPGDSPGRVPTFGLVPEHATPRKLAERLSDAGIYTWDGNFFAKRVIETLGLDLDEGVLRIGFAHYNTLAEVDRFLEVFEGLLA